MKKALILSIAGVAMMSSLVPATFAMGTSSQMMMSKHTMMSADLNRLPVSQVAQKLGYTWSKDRMMLAKMAGVTNYR